MTVIVPHTNKINKYGKIKLKPCQFPKCDNLFQGTGFSKYCPEHRKREYRKVIDKLHRKPVITENPNQYFKHEHDTVSIVEFTCILCNVAFEIKVYPNIFIYPKYCDEHRNEHKRRLWQKTNSHIVIPPIDITSIVDNIPVDVLPVTLNPEVLNDLNDTFMEYDDDIESILEESPDILNQGEIRGQAKI